MKIMGRKQQEKGPLSYGIEASFCQQTWGKVTAMSSQIKDIMREEERKKTTILQTSIRGWIYSCNFRRKRSIGLLNKASNGGWILKI